MKQATKLTKESLQVAEKRYRELHRMWHDFSDQVKTEGALSVKEKHLIALSIAIVKHCEPCTKVHLAGALDKGASIEEIMEVCWVATEMDGGPVLGFVPTVIKILKRLERHA